MHACGIVPRRGTLADVALAIRAEFAVPWCGTCRALWSGMNETTNDAVRMVLNVALRGAGFSEEAPGDWRHADGRLVRLDLAHSEGMAWVDAAGLPREVLTYRELIERL